MSPQRKRDEIVATLAMVLVAAIALSQCSHAHAGTVSVPGTITLIIVNPPEPLSCGLPGWRFLYVPNGTVYRAHSGLYHYDTLVLEITPAIEECVFIDGFEQPNT